MRFRRNRALWTAVLLAACTLPATAQLARLQSSSRSFHTGDQVDEEAYRPQHTACADMDGDGYPDLVIAHTGNVLAPKVSVMFNRGNGSFGDPVLYDAPGQTMEVVLEDLDGDGDRDAAFAQSDDGSAGSRVLVYENTGDGTLLPYVSYTVGTGPTGLVATDVDGDGDLDLVSANFFWLQEDVTVLYNDGDGVFGTRTDFAIAGHNPVKVAAGDLNGDGAPELVVSLDAGDPAFAVLENDGTGGFGAPTFYSTGSSTFDQADVAVADVDADGDADVLYGTAGRGACALFPNTGSGLLAPHDPISVGSAFGVLYDIAVADVTGDGWLDVLGTGKLDREGFVLVPGDGAGGFAQPTSFRTGEYSRSVVTVDVTGDGDLDAVITNAASLTVTVHENDGTGFSLPPLFPIGSLTYDVADGDLDGDGDVDLLAGDPNGFYRLVNRGDGSFDVASQASASGKVYMKLRDLDGDGFPDAVFGGSGLSRALNDGTGTMGPIHTEPLSSAIGDVDTIDVDNDGDLDALVTGSTFGQAGFYTLENDGTGSFAPPVFFGSAAVSSTGRVETGDFTTDGVPDVLAASWGEVWLWNGDGAGGFGTPASHDLGTGGAASMTAGDFDGDGCLDFAGSDWGTAPTGETLTVVFGNGDGTFTAPVTYFGMFSQWNGGIGGLDCGDVDGDADLDLFGGCNGADDVALFLNNGDRSFAPEERYGVDGDVQWLVTADLDGDARSDVAANVVNSSTVGGGVTVLLDAENGPYVDLGFGLPGSAGTPVLDGTGIPLDGAAVALALSGAAPSAPSILLVSMTRIDAPVLGGTLVPGLDAPLLFTTDAVGAFTFATTWPSGLPLGASFYAQAWTLDGGAVQGVSASNAIRAVQQAD